MTVVVVHVGLGNVGSVVNALARIGVDAKVSSDPKVVSRAARLILPGVGSFDSAMIRLERSGLHECILEQARNNGIPVLGICLGMQLLADSSEEGSKSGFGLVPGRVARLSPRAPEDRLRLPHMGWNRAIPFGSHRLFRNIPDDARFYFVHSFGMNCEHATDVLAETTYGRTFASAVARDNVMGVQFHPEKSHGPGQTLLVNFLEAAG